MNYKLTETLKEADFERFIQVAASTKDDLLAGVSLLTLVRAIKINRLGLYENNRSGNVNTGKIKEISANFRLSGFGTITACHRSGKLELVDGHHRMLSVIKMNDEAMLGDNRNSIVALRIIPQSERLNAYQSVNAGKGHTLKDKLNNPDLALGAVLQDIQNLSGQNKEFNKKHVPNFADLVVAYDLKGAATELEHVYMARKDVTMIVNKHRDRRSYDVSGATRNTLAAFLQKYQSLVNYVTDEKQDIKSEIISIIESPGFFITMGLDHVTKGAAVTNFSRLPNEKILKLVSKNVGKVKEHTMSIARRNRQQIDMILLKKCFKA